jgi:hypothetical protein
MIVLAACGTLITIGSAFNENPFLSLFGFAVWLSVPVAAADRGLAKRKSSRTGVPYTGAPPGPRWRLVVSVLLLLTLVGGISYERCSHARYFAWGALPVAIIGDACGNPRHLRPFVVQLWNDQV